MEKNVDRVTTRSNDSCGGRRLDILMKHIAEVGSVRQAASNELCPLVCFIKMRVDRTRGVQQPSKLKIAEFDSPYPLQF